MEGGRPVEILLTAVAGPLSEVFAFKSRRVGRSCAEEYPIKLVSNIVDLAYAASPRRCALADPSL